MNTTDDTPAPSPRPTSPPSPTWRAVIAQRLGFAQRRTLPRVGRIVQRTAVGLDRLAVAIVLIIAIKSAPLLRAAVGSPAWGQYASELTDRILGWKTYLGAGVALALAWLIGPGTTIGLVVSLILAVPALVVFSLPPCRMIYGHTTFGRARRRFGVEGWADFWELHWGLSAHTVRQVAVHQRPRVAQTLPAVPSRHHVGAVAVAAAHVHRTAMIERLPVSQCGTWLGRSAVGPWWGVQTYAAYRDVIGLIAPPQSGKTALMTHHVIDHPGAVVSTSTKPEIYEMTAALRAAISGWEHVALFNPDNLGVLGSTLRWCPVRGCADFRFATTRAGLLVGARERSNDDDNGRWDEWATEVLAGLLMVADLDGRTMADIAGWVHNAMNTEHGAAYALSLMREAYPNRIPQGVADSLGQLLGTEAKKTRDSVFFALRGAVGFMADPTVAALATPGRDEPVFDVETFLDHRGALYLLGSEEQNAGTAPLLAAFTGHVFATAKTIAARRGGRLDPPLLLSLDEAALITPVPLHKWVADAGGRAIHIIWSVQTPSQLRDTWTDEGADTILNATNALLVYGGLKHGKDLEEASTWCGYRHELVDDPDGDGPGHAKFERVPVCPPDRVRLLPQWHALLIYRQTPATVIRIWPAWQRRDVRRAGRARGAPLPERQRAPHPARPPQDAGPGRSTEPRGAATPAVPSPRPAHQPAPIH